MGRLGAVLHQVTNTVGDQIASLMPAAGSGGAAAGVPQAPACLAVFDMRGGCRFAFTPPESALFALSIRYAADAPRFTATLRLCMRRFSDRPCSPRCR
jgi:DUF1365 family protein